MFNLKPTYPIGIDIGDQNISAIQLKETEQGLAVREWGYKQLEKELEGNPAEREDLVSALKDMIKNKKFAGKRAVVNIPPKNISSFPIQFQVRETENIESVIVRESKEYIPFPVTEAIIDYPSTASTAVGDGNQYKATVIAVHKDQIKQYLLMLKQAGLSVEIIDFGLSSLIRLHQYLNNAIHDPVILCHIGHTQSLLSIVSEDGILAQHHVPWGIHPLFKKLQDNLGLSGDSKAAKILLKKYGLLYENRESTNSNIDIAQDTTMDSRSRATHQIIEPYIHELIYEFQKMIAYVRSEERNTAIKSIYIYGQGTLIHHMDRFFEKRLNIPTKLINPLEKITFSDNGFLSDVSEDVPFALALGLAMRKIKWL
jgi:type IV pilus assembly protein PilM